MYGQMDSFQLVRKIALLAISAESDFQGHLYVVTRFNELIKLDDTGSILRKYSNNYLGQLQLVSIHNPLQIALFYPGFQTLIILDNSLNEVKRIDLARLNIPYVTTLGYSAEREIWFFDEPLKQFKKVNINGRHILESTLGNQYQPARVHKIRIQKNEIKAWCDSASLITMDQNGNLKEIVQQAGEWVYWKENTTGFFYDQKFQVRSGDPALEFSQSIFPEDVPRMLGLTVINKGFVSFDQDGILYFFSRKANP